MKNKLKKIFKIFSLIAIVFFTYSIISVLIFRFVPIPYTPLMLIKKINNHYPINHQWVSLDKISKNMSKAVVRSEDAKFYDHHGFDFEAIQKARKFNEKHKRKKGASTISQQTAKNIFLWPSRTYIRKGMEAYFTVLIEFFWTKDRIMEVYLNSIEFGPGIYGVEAASKRFFKKPAAHLSMQEAALLTAVLPNPIKFKVDHPSSYILKRQSRIIGRMNVIKPVETEYKDDDLDIDIENTDSEDNTVITPSLEPSVESEKAVQ